MFDIFSRNIYGVSLHSEQISGMKNYSFQYLSLLVFIAII